MNHIGYTLHSFIESSLLGNVAYDHEFNIIQMRLARGCILDVLSRTLIANGQPNAVALVESSDDAGISDETSTARDLTTSVTQGVSRHESGGGKSS